MTCPSPDGQSHQVTRILQGIEKPQGDENLAQQLLPLVYEELRKLAAHRMAGRPPGQTLQATALVHEAYLRLVGPDESARSCWDNRGHFFAAAAEAMRRILIDRARRKQSIKHGGDLARATWAESQVANTAKPDEILAVDEALTKLGELEPQLADVVKLRYFVGMTVPEAAEALGVSPSTIDRQWAAARAWLYREINEGT